MHIRKLCDKDAPYMIEWMHDKELTYYFNKDFSNLTIDDALTFIRETRDDCIHLAICADNDEYMGTVSLKNINNGTAEFAISVRRKAMGRGYAWYGMERIIGVGFDELNLNSIYWCVSTNNRRAIKFYEKHSFHRVVDVPQNVLSRYSNQDDLLFYTILSGDEINTKKYVAGCKTIKISTVSTLDSGELSFFEEKKDVPFELKRIYYISKVPEGTKRGFHAHKQLKQFLFCPYGSILLILDDGVHREEIELSDPSVGVLIDKPTWREMIWLQRNSVLCVAASEYYTKEDYIRDYSEFLKYIKRIH